MPITLTCYQAFASTVPSSVPGPISGSVPCTQAIPSAIPSPVTYAISHTKAQPMCTRGQVTVSITIAKALANPIPRSVTHTPTPSMQAGSSAIALRTQTQAMVPAEPVCT